MTAILPNQKTANGAGSDEPFTYTTAAGDSFTVSSLAKPFHSAGELRKHRRDNPVEIAYFVIERDLTKDQLKVIDALDMDEFNTFSKAWAEHSGIDLGE